MPQQFTDVACTVCGCVCDDLTVTVDGGRVVAADRACRLAEPWFRAQSDGDTAVSFDADVRRAADILTAARYPLVYGLSRSTTEGQRAAVALADRLGATIDTTASTGHAPSILALQQVGESTCTLGEVKQRADLVIFWGTDPLTTHPRHIERYCPPRPGRTIVVVDEIETETARAADLFVTVQPGRHWEALWELRMSLVSPSPLAPLPPGEGGTDGRPLQHLARMMSAARFGIVFFGAGLTQQPHAHRVIEALLQLVTDLNHHSDPATRRRFYARRMRRYGDVAGADSVLTWQTGYPFGVNFAAGYPRYNPGEFTGPDILARKEADACVLIGSETAKDLPPAALAHLKTIPVIVLDPPGAKTDLPAAVKFTTAVYGVHKPGTAYRLDEVPIPLRVLLPTELPSDADVLNAILSELG
jgi:formylmethanofuran dehydrogenase subunit B